MYQSTENIYNCNCEKQERNINCNIKKSNVLYMCLKKCILYKNQEKEREEEGEEEAIRGREGLLSPMATFTVLVKSSANTKALGLRLDNIQYGVRKNESCRLVLDKFENKLPKKISFKFNRLRRPRNDRSDLFTLATNK